MRYDYCTLAGQLKLSYVFVASSFLSYSYGIALITSFLFALMTPFSLFGKLLNWTRDNLGIHRDQVAVYHDSARNCTAKFHRSFFVLLLLLLLMFFSKIQLLFINFRNKTQSNFRRWWVIIHLWYKCKYSSQECQHDEKDKWKKIRRKKLLLLPLPMQCNVQTSNGKVTKFPPERKVQ